MKVSGNKSRNKGAAGEREFFKLVEEHLGVKLRRNLSQYQEEGQGDADKELAGFALEIKRGKIYEKRWWTQSVEQSQGLIPALCYRLDRKPWRIRIPGFMVSELLDYDQEDEKYTLDISLEAFFQIVRERM